MQLTSVRLGDFAATLEKEADVLEPVLAGVAGAIGSHGQCAYREFGEIAGAFERAHKTRWALKYFFHKVKNVSICE